MRNDLNYFVNAETRQEGDPVSWQMTDDGRMLSFRHITEQDFFKVGFMEFSPQGCRTKEDSLRSKAEE